jgi:FixJ family two-component response regulator
VETFNSVEALLARGVLEGDACLVLDVDLPGIGSVEFSPSRALISPRFSSPRSTPGT